ncbi:mas-related G-protein coupled receptor member X2-like [Peromyscus californicus insignis]|uniref:mas-related G-protein coupled receptor member X2-like n=1 Tax=Peromyscus californicus insignis TaxID=564181 RepID=UPI0022A6C238|nr:mas-related G-protein coupled receptor member X2-like [Peromyscus californicus insignis]
MSPTDPTGRTDITTVNGSDNILTTSCDATKFTLNFLIVIIGLVGLAGNVTVLWLLGFHMSRNAFSVYIFNLAGADFLFLFFNVVNSIHVIISMFRSIFISRIFNVLFNFAYLAGLSMLSAMSTEHCLSALWPIWYRCQRPRHTSAVMCALLWALSLLLSILQGEACNIFFNGFAHGWCEKLDSIIFAWLIVLFVVLAGSSLALLLRVFCGSHRIPVTRLFVTIALTVLIFLLFGLSYGINWFLLDWIENFYRVFPCNVYEMSAFLSCVNSCANPIIYFLVGSIRHRRFQCQTLRLFLQKAMQDTPEEEVGEQCYSGKSGELETV